MSSHWATGSCLCGTVQYTLSKEPDQLERIICHCVLCKKASGSAFMTNWWMADNGVRVFKIVAGADNLNHFVVTTAMSGHNVTRYFCRGCGSPIYLKAEHPRCEGLMGFTAGTLDFDKQLPAEENRALAWVPSVEVFTEDRLTSLPAIQGVAQQNNKKLSE